MWIFVLSSLTKWTESRRFTRSGTRHEIRNKSAVDMELKHRKVVAAAEEKSNQRMVEAIFSLVMPSQGLISMILFLQSFNRGRKDLFFFLLTGHRLVAQREPGRPILIVWSCSFWCSFSVLLALGLCCVFIFWRGLIPFVSLFSTISHRPVAHSEVQPSYTDSRTSAVAGKRS
ncbi:hypothetical protein MLD38_020757 [Melastoma candidum]|uniref:Uncharacterized protein n=1 Tax=Melastoma candidum TaxID=119954 RepID=A0ACB9QEG6_9MYRT|nr:hypothetical protein MLD38_020757 [Melastoma candidum]